MDLKGQEEIDKNQYHTVFLKERLLPCVLGAVVADSLGVPVEFKERSYLKDNPVTKMLAFGTYNQP